MLLADTSKHGLGLTMMMATLAQEEIQHRRPLSNLEEEAFLNLQRTAGNLFQAFNRVLRPFELTPTQYNVLRILRGAHPARLTCGEVGERMVNPEPDVTRIIDRLISRGLVSRERDESDRRIVRVEISEHGLLLLAKLDEPVRSSLRELLSHLGETRLQRLVVLLEEIHPAA